MHSSDKAWPRMPRVCRGGQCYEYLGIQGTTWAMNLASSLDAWRLSLHLSLKLRLQTILVKNVLTLVVYNTPHQCTTSHLCL